MTNFGIPPAGDTRARMRQPEYCYLIIYVL